MLNKLFYEFHAAYIFISSCEYLFCLDYLLLPCPSSASYLTCDSVIFFIHPSLVRHLGLHYTSVPQKYIHVHKRMWKNLLFHSVCCGKTELSETVRMNLVLI